MPRAKSDRTLSKSVKWSERHSASWTRPPIPLDWTFDPAPFCSAFIAQQQTFSGSLGQSVSQALEGSRVRAESTAHLCTLIAAQSLPALSYHTAVIAGLTQLLALRSTSRASCDLPKPKRACISGINV